MYSFEIHSTFCFSTTFFVIFCINYKRLMEQEPAIFLVCKMPWTSMELYVGLNVDLPQALSKDPQTDALPKGRYETLNPLTVLQRSIKQATI